MSQTKIYSQLADLYRQDFVRLLAVLTRIFGTENLDLVEDTLQEAFSKALTQWQVSGIPDNPAAWLVTAAKNRAIDVIRANKNKIKLAADLSHFLESEWSLGSTIDAEFSEAKIQDDQLRMIFVCCHPSISADNQIPIILQMLCGLTIEAIARALLIPVATVKKRLLRTKQLLKQQTFRLPESEQMNEALTTVHRALYLLFNEGFHGAYNKATVNRLFCLEAIGLTRLLINAGDLANEETYALFALLHFHMARADARMDDNGKAIPLDMQDRSRWDTALIAQGDHWLAMAQSAEQSTEQSTAISRFLIEALIAREHSHAPSFEATRWQLIIFYYQQLIAITESPIARLNQAVAIAYAGNLTLAMTQVAQARAHKLLQNSHLPDATLAHLHAKANNPSAAHYHATQAQNLGGSSTEHELMLRQIHRLLSAHDTQI